jgi:hypothetical protein
MRRAATASSAHVLTLPTHHGRSHSRREAAVQRLPPLEAGGRTDADWHQAAVGSCYRRRLERPLFEVQRS